MIRPLFMAGEIAEREQTKEELYALLNEGLRKFGEESIEGLNVFSFTGERMEIQEGKIV